MPVTTGILGTSLTNTVAVNYSKVINMTSTTSDKKISKWRIINNIQAIFLNTLSEHNY